MSDDATFAIRDGTQDQQCFDEVILNNQYELPDAISPDAIVIDVGANVGAFSVACLLRGAGTVVAVEPCPNNYIVLNNNVRPWTAEGKVVPVRAAVWRSDIHEKLNFVGFTESTACGGVFAVNEKVHKIANTLPAVPITPIGLDQLIHEVTDGGKRRVDILKVDAEGSEYAILYTCRGLKLVDTLLLEVHQAPNVPPDVEGELFGWPLRQANAAYMKTFLEGHGFTVRTKQESFDNQINTLLFCTRTTETK